MSSKPLLFFFEFGWAILIKSKIPIDKKKKKKKWVLANFEGRDDFKSITGQTDN